MPFLAPALPFIIGAGSAASALGSGRAAGRQQEADTNQRQDQLRLQGARLGLEAPGMRARSSVQGDMLAGMQPYAINGPVTHTGGKMPSISGGLSPSLLSSNTRQLGRGMSRDALLSQMKGDPFTPTALPQPSGFDKFLNIVGGIGGTLGHLPLGGGGGASSAFGKPNLGGTGFTMADPGRRLPFTGFAPPAVLTDEELGQVG